MLAAGFVCFQIESDSVADANDIEGHTHILFFLVYGSKISHI